MPHLLTATIQVGLYREIQLFQCKHRVYTVALIAHSFPLSLSLFLSLSPHPSSLPPSLPSLPPSLPPIHRRNLPRMSAEINIKYTSILQLLSNYALLLTVISISAPFQHKEVTRLSYTYNWYKFPAKYTNLQALAYNYKRDFAMGALNMGWRV